MNDKRNFPGNSHQASIRDKDVKGILVLCLACLFLAVLACSLPSDRASDSLDETRVALEVEGTILAIEKARLTLDAESQAQPPAPTSPPPTQPPPPPPTEPQPTEAPVDTAPTQTLEPTEETMTAVEGSLVRAPYDPAYGWGSGHDSEDFDGSTGLFPSSSAGAASAYYSDGRYNITFTTRGRWTWYWTFVDAIDFYADVVVFNGDKCVTRDRAGIVFRGDSTWDYGLMFGITCGGEYFIGFTAIPGVDGVICAFNGVALDCDNKNLKPSNLIQTGSGAINRIGVRADGTDLDFYINGKSVGSISFGGWVWSPIFLNGTFALYLGTGQSPDSSVSFDDFNLWHFD